MTVEYRIQTQAEVRVDDAVKGRVTVVPCLYNVLDSYRTVWNPGVWSDDLATRFPEYPKYVWAHDWHEPIGHAVDMDDSPQRIRFNFQLDDMDAVPRARQAYAQLRSGTMNQHSFGFDRREWVDDAADDVREYGDGVTRFTRAAMDEVSPVLVGAVPGTHTQAVRSTIADGMGVRESLLREYERKVATGEMEWQEAAAEMRLRAAADVRGVHSHAKQDGSGTVRHSHTSDTGMHAHSGLMPMTAMRTDASTESREQADTTTEQLEQAADALLRRARHAHYSEPIVTGDH